TKGHAQARGSGRPVSASFYVVARHRTAGALAPARRISSSELAAEGELQALDLVAILLLQRERVADRNRSDRRAPQQGDTGGCTQFVGLEVVGAGVDVADIEEGRDACRGAVEQFRE